MRPDTRSTTLAKLEYVDRVAKRIGDQPPKIQPRKRDEPVEEMRYTVSDYYEHRRESRLQIPRWFDGDLKQLFETETREGHSPAEPLLREKRHDVISEVAYWTGVQMGSCARSSTICSGASARSTFRSSTAIANVT